MRGPFVHAGRDTLIVLCERERTKAGNTAVTFEVRDIEATASELCSHGFSFEEYDFPGLKAVDGIARRDADVAPWFKDREGNTLRIHAALAA